LTGADGALRYGEDSKGRFAIYRLKAGEALYSAVAVRFTGRVDPEEVNQVAEVMARASGIEDVTDIAVDHPVRIPMDLLLPEFLPPGDPRRVEHDRARAEAGRYRNPARARNLERVHVILDAGHGGVDHGAISNGVHEHEYAYDVMCRLKRRLEEYTGATVHPTIVDRRLGFKPRGGRTLRSNEAEQILTTPRHSNSNRSQVLLGVNLRWYLANSIYRRLRKEGVPSERVVFISLHADSLHPSLSGGMVYIPGARYRKGTYGYTRKAYSRYREVKERPRVSFTRAEGIQSEGLSREFAWRVVEAMRRHGLAVHPHIPVRDRIIRRKRVWVPAVLRGNEVPVKILVEIANLNNRSDARRLKDPDFREKTARALADALLRYYGPA
jgi:N-acetylmuramoyl-L-alanine amidase